MFVLVVLIDALFYELASLVLDTVVDVDNMVVGIFLVEYGLDIVQVPLLLVGGGLGDIVADHYCADWHLRDYDWIWSLLSFVYAVSVVGIDLLSPSQCVLSW